MFALRYDPVSGGYTYGFAGQSQGQYADGEWFYNRAQDEAEAWTNGGGGFDLAFWASFGVSGKSCGADVSVS